MTSDEIEVAGGSALTPYDPSAPCPKCLNEELYVVWHQSQIYDLARPCGKGAVGEHLCLGCARCGYRWSSAAADAPVYAVRTDRAQEEVMTIRKTGSAEDQAVVGIEGQPETEMTQAQLTIPETGMPEQTGHGDSYEEE
jgi:hypothetical protein